MALVYSMSYFWTAGACANGVVELKGGATAMTANNSQAKRRRLRERADIVRPPGEGILEQFSGSGGEPGDVLPHAVLEGRRIEGVASRAQTGHRRLREVLIGLPQIGRCIKKLDLLRPPERREYRARQIKKRPGLAAPHVINPAIEGPFHQRCEHIDDVINEHKVARLMAVGDVRPMALEEPDAPGCANLIERLDDDARHRSFVPLAKPVDVEKLEAAPLLWMPAGAFLGERPQVELQLGIAVCVERLQSRQRRLVVFIAERSVAIGRSAAGIDKRNAKLGRATPQLLG